MSWVEFFAAAEIIGLAMLGTFLGILGVGIGICVVILGVKKIIEEKNAFKNSQCKDYEEFLENRKELRIEKTRMEELEHDKRNIHKYRK